MWRNGNAVNKIQLNRIQNGNTVINFKNGFQFNLIQNGNNYYDYWQTDNAVMNQMVGKLATL